MTITRNGQKGAALISTLFFLIITTALAAGALVLSTVQVKVASSISRWESAFSAADGGINHVVPLIKYVHFDGLVHPDFAAIVTDPTASLVAELQTDVYGLDTQDVLLPADPSGSGNLYNISIDIDPIGTSISPGSGIEAAWAYHGGAYGSGLYRAYRISSEAATVTGSSRARLQQVLWLRAVM